MPINTQQLIALQSMKGLIFKWLKDERYAPDVDVASEESEPIFLPVEVEAAVNPIPTLTTTVARRIEIEIPGGYRIYVCICCVHQPRKPHNIEGRFSLS